MIKILIFLIAIILFSLSVMLFNFAFAYSVHHIDYSNEDKLMFLNWLNKWEEIKNESNLTKLLIGTLFGVCASVLFLSAILITAIGIFY